MAELLRPENERTAAWGFLERLRLRVALTLDSVRTRPRLVRDLAHELGVTEDELLEWGVAQDDAVLAGLIAHRS
jgi:hypothetical protein